MRPSHVLVVVALAACASGNAPPRAEVPETVRISGGGGGAIQVNTTPTSATNVATIPAGIDAVWRALPMVFDSLGVTTNTVDPRNHLMGNNGVKIRRQLGNVPLSRYIDCGNTQGPPSADTYEIQFSVLTQLTSGDASSTTMSTTVEARGRPVTMAGEYSRCISKGALEQAIASATRARIH